MANCVPSTESNELFGTRETPIPRIPTLNVVITLEFEGGELLPSLEGYIPMDSLYDLVYSCQKSRQLLHCPNS
jgi:hypothetical protein